MSRHHSCSLHDYTYSSTLDGTEMKGKVQQLQKTKKRGRMEKREKQTEEEETKENKEKKRERPRSEDTVLSLQISLIGSDSEMCSDHPARYLNMSVCKAKMSEIFSMTAGYDLT